MKKVKALKRCRVAGKVIEINKTADVSDKDARLLVAYKQAEYVNKADNVKAKGLSTKNGPVATGMK